MKAQCPVCDKHFDLDLEAGDIRCPSCSAPLRAEAFGETQSIDVGTIAKKSDRGEGGDEPAGDHTRKTSRLRVKLLPESESETRTAPREFAGYRILEELGRGGMGVVYKALDAKLDRTVAIKVLLSAEHASAGDVGRFFREALSVAKLQHPNIVPIYEMKTHDGRHYFTMDYVEGMPLDRYIKEKRPGLRRSLELVEKVALALHHAHSRGVIHRDLKPANIIITPENEPRVTDFGLAKTLSDEGQKRNRDLTKTGLAIGTPHYMAPEQAAGRSKEADARTDVYSLGCVLYELVSGRPPFQGASTMDVLQKHIDEMPVKPTGRGMRLPDDVATICVKCLEKEPGRRYLSAEELARDIRHYLEGDPIAARRASMAYIVKHQIVRHKALALVVSAALGLLVASVTAHIFSLRRERNQVLRQLYYANIALAHRHAQEANVAHVDRILHGPGCPPDLRGWEWGRVKREAHQEMASTRLLRAVPRNVRFSPDGDRILARVDRLLVTFNARTGREMSARAVPADNKLPGVASPDGKYRAMIGEHGEIRLTDIAARRDLPPILPEPTSKFIWLTFGRGGLLAATSTDKHVRIWRIGPAPQPKPKPKQKPKPKSKPKAGTEPARPTDAAAVKKAKPAPAWVLLSTSSPHKKSVCLLAFGPRGQTLLSGDTVGNLKFLRVRDGRDSRILLGHTADISRVIFSPDRRLLASSSVDRTVRIWNAHNGRQLHCLRGHSDAVGALAFSPNGKYLASCGTDRTVKIWDLRSERTHIELKPGMGAVASVVIGPRAERLYAGTSGGVSVWDPRTGKAITRWPDLLGNHSALAISSDGNLLACAGSSGRVIIRDSKTGKIISKLLFVDKGHDVLAIAFDPDGRRLAAAGSRGAVRVWDVASSRELPRPSGHTSTVRALCYSTDGRHIVTGADDYQMRIWDAGSGRLLSKSFDAAGVETTCWAVAVSPNGRRVASAFLNRIQIQDVASSRRRQILRGHAVRVYSLAYSPDGRRLASASKDGTVRLWDTDTGRELLRLSGHSDWVSTVAFGPRGRLLVSGSRDGTVRVWLADGWAAAHTED